jgi:hypothetical protein
MRGAQGAAASGSAGRWRIFRCAAVVDEVGVGREDLRGAGSTALHKGVLDRLAGGPRVNERALVFAGLLGPSRVTK